MTRPSTASEPRISRNLDDDRDEYGPITGRPFGAFTAGTAPSLLDDRDGLGRRLADHLL